MTYTSLSLRGENEVSDAAIHRVSQERGRGCLFAYWFTVDRHGLSALAMTKGSKEGSLLKIRKGNLKFHFRPGSNPGGFGFPVSGNIFDGN